MKCLDPRLRRLVRHIRDKEPLAVDVGRSYVRATVEVEPGFAPDPSDVMTSALVMLRGNSDIPEPLAYHDWTHIVDTIYTVELPASELDRLAEEPEILYVEASREFAPALDSSVPEIRADRVHTASQGGFDGHGVVVGLIDIGFDFTLDDFRNPDSSTRVAFLWDQTLEALGSESPPAGFTQGVEYTRADIDVALQSPEPFALVRHLPEPGSHGTHVAGIAAGNGRGSDGTSAPGRYGGVAPGATLVLVQPRLAGDGSFTDSPHVAQAIAYAFEKADELELPCVINMSLGQNGGSHDGESLVERAIDRLLETPGRAVVVAAGNEHVWRGHASGMLSTAVQSLSWGVLNEGDRSPNAMEIWHSSRDLVRLRVLAPDGESSPWASAGAQKLHTFAGGEVVFIDNERFTRLNGDARIFVEVNPPTFGAISSGAWSVEIECFELREGRFDAFIERDIRHPKIWQSFFVGGDFDPRLTLGTPATARRVIAVASYDHRIQAPAASSGRGPTRDGRRKPELAAPGVEIVSSFAQGGREDGHGGTFPLRLAMSGTSMSAPHVAGTVALMLEADPDLTADQIRSVLAASARAPTGVAPFDPAWGYGILDAEAAVNLVR